MTKCFAYLALIMENYDSFVYLKLETQNYHEKSKLSENGLLIPYNCRNIQFLLQN